MQTELEMLGGEANSLYLGTADDELSRLARIVSRLAALMPPVGQWDVYVEGFAAADHDHDGDYAYEGDLSDLRERVRALEDERDELHRDVEELYRRWEDQ